MAYACVAIPSQTQLQEDLPEDVRGRVFGILNMLVSVASFAPILIVGPLSDQVGTVSVLIAVGLIVALCGLLSIVRRGPMHAHEPVVDGSIDMTGAPMDPVAIATAAATATAAASATATADDDAGHDGGRARRHAAAAASDTTAAAAETTANGVGSAAWRAGLTADDEDPPEPVDAG